MLDLIPALISTILGSLITLMANSQKNKVEMHKMTMEAMAAKNKQINTLNEYALKNKGFSFMRRLIAFLVTTAVLLPVFYGINHPDLVLNLITEQTTGGTYFFGLIDTTETKEIVIKMEGAVMFKETLQGFMLILFLFFGSEMAKQ